MSANKYDGTTLVETVDKEAINRALLDLLKKVNEIGATADTALAGVLPPIGYVYTQGPDDMSPADLWPSATWENVSSEEAGSFRRFEGGSASAFASGQQADAFQGHFHDFYLPTSSTGGSRFSVTAATQTGSGVNALTGSSPTISPITDGPDGTPRTATETRPVNYTVRKWRRTA